MIIPDVNMLLYAEIDCNPNHAAARRWWEALMNGDRQVGLASPCIFGFIRISTNRRVFRDPLPIDDAIERVQRWLERSHVSVLVPGRRHLDLAFGMLRRLGTGADLTTDVQIAAQALEVNGEVHSNDGDFARFENVRWVNPLVAR